MSAEQSAETPTSQTPETPTSQTPETPTSQTPVDITQQATNPTPKPREKNPKRVAAGKLVAERTRFAREQQKKAAAEASVIIANNNAKQPPPPAKENSGPLTITQWLMVGSIAVGLAGIYYKREELKVTAKTLFSEKERPEPDPAPTVSPQPKPKAFGMRD